MQRISFLDDQSRPESLSQNLTSSHVFKISQHDSPWMLNPEDAAAGSLEDVSPKTPDVHATLKTMALNVPSYVLIRLDVAAMAGAGCC